jgi:hypothetical protein
MSKGIIDMINKNQNDIRFLLDSGAFTAWKSNKPIKLDDYCKFIENLPFKPWRYFTLDVIGDAEASFKNYQIMLDRGFNPVPIFTRGEDLSMIDEYYKTSDVLGVGGLVGTKGNKGFVKGFMKKVDGRKVHWLGFTNKNFVSYYKPYMCDSSSWEGGARFGTFDIYMGNGRYERLKRTDFSKKPKPEIIKAIKSYGFNPSDFAKESAWRGGQSLNRTINAATAVRATLDIEKKLNTKQFSACATSLALSLLLQEHKKERNQ